MHYVLTPVFYLPNRDAKRDRTSDGCHVKWETE
jgi:hypothetical protein